ncbi:MAG: adenylate/guanylate cyclase domain-containing protein [Spirochaetes bacterium]|nr:adenylate/guanylate cyclase domain-containing protein [Spirochaetota bacterium]
MIDKIIDFFKKLLHIKLKKKKSLIRKVYFGIRIRFLGFIFLALSLLILFFTLIFYLDLRIVLKNEKKSTAAKLIQALSGPAEFYLDRDKNTSREEIIEKYNFINKEANNFMQFDKDILKIWLINNKAKVLFSTFKGDEGKSYGFSYFMKALEKESEDVFFKTFKIKNSATKKKDSYLAISYPIFLRQGDVVRILKDFDAYYKKYHNLSMKNKRQIYYALWRKYRNLLPDEFDPGKQKTDANAKVTKLWDIDFIFLNLFAKIIYERQWKIKPGENYLWNDRWLSDLKYKRKIADENNNIKEETQISLKIDERMNYLTEQIKEFTRIGVLAILYNMDNINIELNKHIKFPLIMALVFLVISLISFLIIINILIKNLKLLEQWAMRVSEGDLDNKLYIETNDEVGRLSDVFNHMIDELKAKFHLEKFVSKSTKSMIEKKIDSPAPLVIGKTGRKNYAFIFSDVRGFTSFTEKNDPDVVINVLNIYFELQAHIIKSKKGDIEDYVGDQIMAHFGGEKKADTAISAAIQIMREIQKLNEKRRHSNLPYFEIGIGIHGGDVVVGNIGAGFRMDFTCLGDAVNLTSRLCSSATPGQILITKELYKQSTKKFKVKPLEPITVKGKADPVEILEVRLH